MSELQASALFAGLFFLIGQAVLLQVKVNRIERRLIRMGTTMGLPRDVDAPSLAQQRGDA